MCIIHFDGKLIELGILLNQIKKSDRGKFIYSHYLLGHRCANGQTGTPCTVRGRPCGTGRYRLGKSELIASFSLSLPSLTDAPAFRCATQPFGPTIAMKSLSFLITVSLVASMAASVQGKTTCYLHNTFYHQM